MKLTVRQLKQLIKEQVEEVKNPESLASLKRKEDELRKEIEALKLELSNKNAELKPIADKLYAHKDERNKNIRDKRLVAKGIVPDPSTLDYIKTIPAFKAKPGDVFINRREHRFEVIKVKSFTRTETDKWGNKTDFDFVLIDYKNLQTGKKDIVEYGRNVKLWVVK